MKFKIGDKIKLKDYGTYSDYKDHKNQKATIIDNNLSPNFDFRIKWLDGETSLVYIKNMIKIPATLRGLIDDKT